MTTDGGGPGDLRGNVARSLGWVFAERWGSRLLQLLVFAVLTRLIAAENFGLISLATSIVAVLRVMVDAGFSKSLIQLKELKPKDASTAFWTSMALAAVVYTALYFLAPVFAGWLGTPELTDVLRILGLTLPLSALSQTPAAILERTFDFKILSVRQLIAATAGALAAIPVALLGFGVWALVTQTLGVALVSVVVLWATTTWRPKFEFSLESLRRIWPIGLSIMGTELLDAIQGNMDKLVIGAVFDAEILGYYYVAQRLGTILMELVTTVISRVSLTTFSRVQDDLPRLNRIFRQLTFAAGAIGVPVFALTAVLAPQIVPTVFGPGWEASIPILWGLAGGWALAAVMYFDRTVLLARGKAKSAFWLSALQNVVGVVLIFALLPLGIAGVVISRWARVFVWPVRLWVLRRAVDLDVRRYLLQIGRAVVAIVPAAVAIALLQLTGWAQGPWAPLTFAVPLGILSLASYAALVWRVAGEENRAVLRPLVGGVIRRLRRR
ncbi:lipopolysaccharide biosynthesis protein [Microbacterium marinilacus]|uniref:Lipopolysaccharide biosynthesis protein n=1 Tax=Microbacterium marinilacus TaxID=415209 RepID=A0ABP7BDD6_9MICO|nr:lipopolysaccharide biosynthesis protein [Microbacterium marinilacus]MBY0689447.1 lipopolysaccharide biosynthesis protein [Microbacterium marinilacus]